METDARRLNVLQICHDYQGPFRRVCHQYAQALQEHRVTTLYLRGKKCKHVQEDTGGDRVWFLDQKSLRGTKFFTILRVAAILRKEKFDIVIAHRYKPIYITGVLGHFFPIKVLLGVAHEHGVFRRMARALFLTHGCRQMNVIAVSETVKKDVLKDAPSLDPANRIFTLNHGIDPEDKKNLMTRREARDALGLNQDAYYFGTVGRLVAKKHHDILIDAYARANLPRTQLVIIGDGGKEDQLKQQVAGMGLDGRVTFTGQVTSAWRYLKAFDVFVMASGPEEAFGMVLLEAMLAELPIISSDAAGPNEVVGDAGILFSTGNASDLADKMETVLGMDNRALRAMGVSGYRRLQESFSLGVFKKRFWALPPIYNLAVKNDNQR